MTKRDDGGPAAAYAGTADRLSEIMEDFMRREPRAMDVDAPEHLFALGFELGDLAPSYFQASWAFNRARARRREAEGGDDAE